MTTSRTGPSTDDRDEFGNPDDWEDVEVDTSALAGGGPVVTFTMDQLDRLFAACKVVDEDSITFVQRAALDRIERVLKQDRSGASAAS